jgi:hypothetical protein
MLGILLKEPQVIELKLKKVICFVLIENQRWPSLQDKILAKNNTVWESS